jgi:Rho GDP-dissociation inhibitor
VTVLTLELVSPTLPPGKKIAFNLADPNAIASLKKTPVVIKEGVEYKSVKPSAAGGQRMLISACSVRITFKVNHSIISVRCPSLPLTTSHRAQVTLGCPIHPSRQA